MSAITIYDIAKVAEVSIATVSRAFNNSPRVSERTRERIFAIAKEMGYQPHASARSLAKRQSQLVSAIIPMLTSYFFLEVLQGVQDRIAESDYDLLVYSAPRMEEIDSMFENALSKGRSAGALLFSSPLNPQRIERLKNYQNPVVLVDLYHDEFDSVSIDNEQGGYIAATHLLDRGYRAIGLLSANPDSVPSSQRVAGYRRAHEERGLIPDDRLVIATSDPQFHGFTEEAGYESMMRLLDLNVEIDAVFAVSDIQALGARRAIEDRGLVVPDDIALVGFDDIMISRYVELTTLRQPMYDMGKMATDILLKRIQQEDLPISHTIFSPSLVERTTSGLKHTRANVNDNLSEVP